MNLVRCHIEAVISDNEGTGCYFSLVKNNKTIISIPIFKPLTGTFESGKKFMSLNLDDKISWKVNNGNGPITFKEMIFSYYTPWYLKLVNRILSKNKIFVFFNSFFCSQFTRATRAVNRLYN